MLARNGICHFLATTAPVGSVTGSTGIGSPEAINPSTTYPFFDALKLKSYREANKGAATSDETESLVNHWLKLVGLLVIAVRYVNSPTLPLTPSTVTVESSAVNSLYAVPNPITGILTSLNSFILSENITKDELANSGTPPTPLSINHFSAVPNKVFLSCSGANLKLYSPFAKPASGTSGALETTELETDELTTDELVAASPQAASNNAEAVIKEPYKCFFI